ncbi:hypothetical protein H0H93_004631, partial [Arthromyces matolae]
GHPQAPTIIAQCRATRAKVNTGVNFHARVESDRFAPGTKPTLIKRARIWTGANNGTEVVYGDILLAKGLIKSVGHFYGIENFYGDDLVVIDAKGAWVTPGIIDIHSHLGDNPSPSLNGAQDDNSARGTIQPWLRSLDGLNTHDESYPLSIAGGVTTALILPGSTNAIGGQAFVIKLRSTNERSPTSMLLEPSYNINNSFLDSDLPTRWRYMKYKKATDLKLKQDAYCARALSGKWKGLGDFPQDLQWEALVDVVRGRVKVNAHCYEAVDLDALIRLSNEFKFPIAAVHHASEAYLVPDVLKKAYGKLLLLESLKSEDSNSANVSRRHTSCCIVCNEQQREAYRSSEFAPRILARHGIKTLLKSDHPISNSRYLLYEAQQAYYYGLPENLAIASVTSHAAEVMVNRDYLAGMDADLVIWDSHPLALGATPVQVFIDGIPQLEAAHVVTKPRTFQESPKVPNFDKEAEEAVKYEGLPPLAPTKHLGSTVVFTNLTSIYLPRDDTIEAIFTASTFSQSGIAVVQNGLITCSGAQTSCLSTLNSATFKADFIDLQGGSIAPGLVSFGSPLGLHHIEEEDSTNDGDVFDPFLDKGVPQILGGAAMVRAADGLLFGSRDAYLAYRAGVTTAITAPTHKNFVSGLGKEVEAESGRSIKLTITGAAEAHILAQELGEAGIGVILNPPRPFPYTWEDRRILPGPPLSRDSAIAKLTKHGVTVGLGCEEIWGARNLPFDIAWAALEAGGELSKTEALALGSVNVRKLLGVRAEMDLVVTLGGELLESGSKVVGVISGDKMRLL